MNALIILIEKQIGKKAVIERHPPNLADMLTKQADVSKARNLLGWQPKVGIGDGVQGLLDWVIAERVWVIGIATG